jgi:adenine phosphoribosyltransferase
LAAATLLKRLGVEIVEAAAIIDLPDLGGSGRLQDAGLAVHTFYAFAGNDGISPATLFRLSVLFG